jgi:hypothetical protein
MSFGTPKNPRTEDITFDVVDKLYPYNAIFGRGLLNTFEAALYSGSLCLKIPATSSVRSVFGSQQEPGTLRRVSHQATKMYISCEKSLSRTTSSPVTVKRKLRQNTKKPSKPRVRSGKSLYILESPAEPCIIGAEVGQQEEAELLAFLDKK